MPAMRDVWSIGGLRVQSILGFCAALFLCNGEIILATGLISDRPVSLFVNRARKGGKQKYNLISQNGRNVSPVSTGSFARLLSRQLG